MYVVDHAKMAVASNRTTETKARLSACWEEDIDWELYPDKVKEVSTIVQCLITLVTSRHIASFIKEHFGNKQQAFNEHWQQADTLQAFKEHFGNKQAHCTYPHCKLLRDSLVASTLRSTMISIQTTLEVHREMSKECWC